VEQEEMNITGQWLGKQAPATIDMHATKENCWKQRFLCSPHQGYIMRTNLIFVGNIWMRNETCHVNFITLQFTDITVFPSFYSEAHELGN
jgi:hypothetical protein